MKILVPLAMVEGEMAQAQIMQERRSRRLKYEEPALVDIEDGRLTDEMLEFLLANIWTVIE